jgi:HSP20 family protein
MLYFRSRPSRDLFAEIDRLQREMQEALDYSPSIRGMARGSFPAINVGGTARSVEIYAFASGIDPASIDVQLEKGTLTIAGERKVAEVPKTATVHIDERFAGRFHRVVVLPEDINPDSIQAKYRDGVLRISIQRKEEAHPRRITVN